MKRIVWVVFILYSFIGRAQSIYLDDGWKFKEDPSSILKITTLYDFSWRTINLPHDFIIERNYTGKNGVGPFFYGITDSIATGNIPCGIGWYRKHFVLPANKNESKVRIVFDGVSVCSDVWCNDYYLGFHPNAYTPFYYDLTPFLHKAPVKNTLTIRVCNSGENSRWYVGAGIYRHVSLFTSGRVYFPIWGIQIKTSKIGFNRSNIKIDIPICNETGQNKKAKIIVHLLNRKGKIVAKSFLRRRLDNHIDTAFVSCQIAHPYLWSPENPYLYKAKIYVIVNGQVTDKYITNFGIRSLNFSTDHGFLLNGKSYKLYGACVHQDNGLLGSATFDKAEIRRVRLLKNNGFNAIRTSHNPPSRQFLDACDSIGVFVIDEAFDTWQNAKCNKDYHCYFNRYSDGDLSAFVQRDRNHPSVIMWSIGNEIAGDIKSIGKIAARLVGVVKANDSSRPVTQAICNFSEQDGAGKNNFISAYSCLDIWGYNYRWRQCKVDHRFFPLRIIVRTESLPCEALQNYRQEQELPYLLGDFVWTGIDYIGETGIGNSIYTNKNSRFATPKRSWPWYLSYCGDIDIIGNKKPQSYYRDVVWERSPMEIFVQSPIPNGKCEIISKWGWSDEVSHWNWNGYEGKYLNVHVYSRCDSVRLILNGKVINTCVPTNLTAGFKVAYVEGKLVALGYKKGKVITTKMLRTSQKPYHIELLSDDKIVTANQNDLAYVSIRVADSRGCLVPNATVKLHLSVKGDGHLLASGNGAPNDMASFRNAICTTSNGRCLAILQPNKKKGTMYLFVSSSGLTKRTIKIKVF